MTQNLPFFAAVSQASAADRPALGLAWAGAHLAAFAGLLCAVWGMAEARAQTTEPPAKALRPRVIREIYVPAEDLHGLLEAADRRVLLKRDEYEKLLASANRQPDEPNAPIPAAVVAADYDGRLEDGRARITGTLALEVLDAGLIALPLPTADVGVLAATLDGQPAALGRDANGGLVLFIQGRGRHVLKLDLAVAVELSAAQQAIHCLLPTPPAARLRLSVPGDVEVKSGAPVVSRSVVEMGETRTTQLELLLPRGSLSLVLSLNNKTLQQNRVVTARSVLVDEVTAAYERLHASISLAVLHGATDQFAFTVPPGFEVTSVATPLLSQWRVDQAGGERILRVTLREPTTQAVVLKVSALRAGGPPEAQAAALANWTWPQLTPRDVAGSAAVVGLFVEDRLRADALSPTDLEPVDVEVLTAALPETVLLAEPGAPRIRAVAAFYAPRASFDLQARFERPAARFTATTNLLLTLEETRQQVLGGFAIRPEFDPLLSFEFTAPAGWKVTEVTAAEGAALPFESYAAAAGTARIRVRLPAAVAPGQVTSVNFQAVATPAGWLGEWTQFPAAFPAFAVLGAAHEEGAISVLASDDLVPRPDQLRGLSPLSQSERARFRLADQPAQLAYRFDALPYGLQMVVERTVPDVSARAYHFARFSPGSLDMRSELIYDVRLARAGRLQFRLPASTPESISIAGRDGLVVKETRSELVEGQRVWTALLGERKAGQLKLVVEFSQRLAASESTEYELPLAVALGAAYQSSLVSVEGSPELDVELRTTARRVDVGELVDAEYQPGRRLVGVVGFLGDDPKLPVVLAPRAGYALLTTIVERAELVTRVAAAGRSVNAARYHLRTKAQYLEVALPPDAQLWTALIDGHPTKPQRDPEGRLLLGWAATQRATLRDVQLVYELPAAPLGLATEIRIAAPRLFIRAERGSLPEEAPIADLRWQLLTPAGYKAVRSRGTVEPTTPETRILPAAKAAAAVVYLAGGVDLFHAELREEFAEFDVALAPRAPTDFAPSWESMDGSAPRQVYDEEKSAQYAYEMPRPTPAEATITPPRPDAADDAQFKLPQTEAPTADPAALLELAAGEGQNSEGRGQMGRQPPAGPAAVTGSAPATSEALAAGPGGQTPHRPGRDPNAPPLRAQSVAPATMQPSTKSALWALEGVSSLPIEVRPLPGDSLVTFQSLGVEPVLETTLADEGRWQLFAWGVFGLIVVLGLLLTSSTAEAQVRLVVGVLLAVTLLPLLTGVFEELDPAFDAAFLAAILVGAWYLLVATWTWLRNAFAGWRAAEPPAAPAPTTPVGETLLVAPSASASATSALLAFVLALAAPAATEAQEGPSGADRAVSPEGVVESPEGILIPFAPLPPVKLPADAVVIPYEPTDDPQADIAKADRVLVPYAEYERLYRLAHPDEQAPGPALPAPFGLAGATYSATLLDGDSLTVTGKLAVEVFAEGRVAVPLALEGGVLSQVALDGKPARAALVRPEAATPPNAPAAQQAAAPHPVGPGGTLTLLYVEGRGRHQIDLVVRLKIERRGGWRVVAGRVPRSPATALALTVPAPRTDVRLSELPDKPSYETTAANETIDTTVGADGRVRLEWRPQVTEAMVDRSLAAESTAIFDVREDGLRLVWTVNLSFPRGQLEQFTLAIPQGYLVEHVAGANVRGWEQQARDGRDELHITLLQAARDAQSATIHLARRVKSLAELADFALPVVNVVDAALERGLVTIRRSPLLELRTTRLENVSRADIPDAAARFVDTREGAHESPLGARAFQTYQFQSTPLAIQLAAREIAPEAAVEVQSLAKISPREIRLESRLALRPQGRPIHRLQVALPPGLDIERVEPASDLEWSLGQVEMRRVLNIYLAAGRSGPFEIVVFGKTPRPAAAGGEADPVVALPTLDVLGVTRQEGDIVVQVDPAFDVQPVELTAAESILLSRTYGWLAEPQRPLARLALHYSGGSPTARLRIVRRTPRVRAVTISNVRLTDRAIEETVYLEFHIADAGIREVEFQLPERFQEARVATSSLRQKSTALVPDPTGNRVRFKLELQDEILGELRILVLHDRLLVAEKQTAPIPQVETGTVDRQYVTLQNTGRDELEVVEARGLDALDRQQMAWHALRGILQHEVTMAYLARGESRAPRLEYQTVQRKIVETASAQIGLAQAVLVVDKSGAYRGQQIYQVDNRTDSFLVVELPAGARLWTARVAGLPVKPAPDPQGDRLVRVPLVKTAAGERDYAVELKYGGQMGRLEGIARIGLPLLRPVNLSPERSQVRLFLPEAYHWGLFGGTARHVPDESALAADVSRYQKQQFENLWETLNRDVGVFTKARAASNLKELQVEMRRFNQTNSALATRSETFRQAQQDNEQALQLVDQNGDVLALVDDSKSMEEDNRKRLNDLVREQENRRGVNVVNDTGRNFSVAPGQTPAPSGSGRFEPTWFRSSGLENPEALRMLDAERREGKPAKTPGASPPGKPGGKDAYLPAGRIQLPAAGLERGPGQGEGGKQSERGGAAYLPEVAQGRNRARLDELAEVQRQNEGSAPSGDESERAKGLRYQQRYSRDLAQQQAQLDLNAPPLGQPAGQPGFNAGGPPQTHGAPATRPTSGAPGGGEVPAPIVGEVQLPAVNGAAPGWDSDYSLPRDFAQAEGTLASLDVDLPIRGREYLFTAPRGEVTITAQGIDQSLLFRLQQAGLVLAVLAAGWFVYAVVRGGLAGVMIVVGLASVICGLFSLAGALLLVVGIGVAIVDWQRNQTAAGAAA